MAGKDTKPVEEPRVPSDEELALLKFKADCLKASKDTLENVKTVVSKAMEELPGPDEGGFHDTNVAYVRSTLAQCFNLIDHTEYSISHQNAG